MQWLQNILEFDRNLFLSLNGRYTDWWDTAMLLFTRKETWLPLYLILIAVVIRNYRNKAWVILLLMVLGVVVSDQVSGLIKDLTMRLRPGHDPLTQQLAHIVLRKGGLYGFVSSHAANSFFVFAFTAPLFRNRASFFTLLGWALIVSWSRIYTGAHFPLDVVGGWLLGILLGWLFFRILTFVETHFFVARFPQIGKTKLSRTNGALVFLTTITVVTTVLLAVHILHKYQYL